ncbi:MAG: thermonuclease family protein [Dehalococcoidia bacterium]
MSNDRNGPPRRYRNRRHIEIDLGPERRRRKNLNRVSMSIAAVFTLILVATVFLPGVLDGDDDPAAPAPGETAAPAITHPIEGAVPVEVVRIIDGDTLEVRSAETSVTVRLFGVDTPEPGEACYDDATERLRDLAGAHVQLLPDARLTDPFGRELRYVYASDGTLIDAALIEDGLGVAWTEDGRLRDDLVATEEEARAAGRGCLWAP